MPVVYEIQGWYTPEYGWEMVTTEGTKQAALQRLKEYREDEPDYPHRVVAKRVKAAQ